MENQFQSNQYTLRRKVLKLVGTSSKIFDPAGQLCFFVNQKAFKLKEDIRVYSDESMTEELILIKARKVIDFSASYDIFDSKTNEKIGVFKRKGFKSMIKDEWIIMDSEDNQIGCIKEDSMLMALLRRLLTSLIPQTFDGLIGETKVFEFRQRVNPFIMKMDMDFSSDTMNLLDRRMGISAAVLLGSIEGRQN